MGTGVVRVEPDSLAAAASSVNAEVDSLAALVRRVAASGSVDAWQASAAVQGFLAHLEEGSPPLAKPCKSTAVAWCKPRRTTRGPTLRRRARPRTCWAARRHDRVRRSAERAESCSSLCGGGREVDAGEARMGGAVRRLVPGGWQGDAAEAYVTHWTRESRQLREMSQAAERGALALSQLADVLEQANRLPGRRWSRPELRGWRSWGPSWRCWHRWSTQWLRWWRLRPRWGWSRRAGLPRAPARGRRPSWPTSRFQQCGEL